MGAVGGGEVHTCNLAPAPDVGSRAMGRGLAALALLIGALTIPTAAHAQGDAPSKRCDFTDPAVCLYPWPNDLFTKSDATTPTGKRLHLRRASMVRNKDGIPIDPANRVLIIRPAVNFDEGERYIVALRRLKNAAGVELQAHPNFKLYRDKILTSDPKVERRREHFESIFDTLKWAGVGRRPLYLAWDFTVARSRSLAGRMLHVRDTAFAALGDRNLRDLQVQGSSPQFTVDSVVNLTPAQDDRIARQVEGTLTVPCFLTNACAPGGQFTFDTRGRPVQQGTTTAKFSCRIPRKALDPA